MDVFYQAEYILQRNSFLYYKFSAPEMYLMRVFVIFLYVIQINAKLILIHSERERYVTRYDNLIQSASEIANQNFNYRFHTVIVSKDVEGYIVTKFIKSYKGSVIMEKRETPMPQQVVLLIKSYFSLIKIQNTLKPDLKGKTLLQSGARFLIVLLSYPHRLERINRLLWSYYATDVIILLKDITGNISLYTYYPYKNPMSCHNVEPTVIGMYDNDTVPSTNLFPDKMGNMHGCPLYISTNKLNHPLIEQRRNLEYLKRVIVRLLRVVMNFTPIITNRDYLSIDSNDPKNWPVTLNDIITGTANISTCSISPGMDRVGILDYSMPYYRIRLAWIAPPLYPGIFWWRLLTPLNGYLWLVLLLVLSIVTSVPLLVKCSNVKKFCYRNFKNADKLHSVAIRIWAIFMGQPIKVMPRRFRDFYVLSLWIWFTFVVRSAYQSVLIGALKSDVTFGKLTDLKEAVHYGYKFGGRAGVLALFEHDPFIRDKFEVIPESELEEVLQGVLDGRNKFVFALSLEYVWAYCMSQGINDNECGYILPDSIMTLPLVMWMTKNSPFKRPLSFWLIRFVESGLLERNAINIPIITTLKSSEPSPLTSHQIISCLLCLIVGYIISSLVLMLEIITNKMKKNKILCNIQLRT